MAKIKLISAAVVLVTSLTTGTIAEDKMNDLEIAHSAYTAGVLDIRYAHLALAISENVDVKAFAQTMIRDHEAVNQQAVALIRKLEVTPQDNELSKFLVKGAAKKREKLLRLKGKKFDCAYAQNELGYHQVVNKTVATAFIPNVTVPELKELLGDALATFKVHERHADRMVDKLNCS